MKTGCDFNRIQVPKEGVLAQDWKFQMPNVPPRRISFLFCILSSPCRSPQLGMYIVLSAGNYRSQNICSVGPQFSMLPLASGAPTSFTQMAKEKGMQRTSPKIMGLPYFLSVLITASYEIITMQSTGDRDTSKGPLATITERNRRQCLKNKKG